MLAAFGLDDISEEVVDTSSLILVTPIAVDDSVHVLAVPAASITREEFKVT